MDQKGKAIQWNNVLRLQVAVISALFLGFLIIVIFSSNPLETFRVFLTGPVLHLNRFGDWIEDAITLTILGLSVCIVFSAKQNNLGAEGQMTLGSLAAGLVILYLPLPPFLLIIVALAAGMLAGACWGIIPGVLKAHMHADELVSSLMLNYVAVKFYEYFITFQLTPEGAGFVASKPFTEESKLASFIPNLPFLSKLREQFIQKTDVTIFLYIAAAIVVLVCFIMFRTNLGYEIRLVGQNAAFAKYSGIGVTRVIVLASLISGAVAGLAGTHVSLCIHRRLLIGVAAGFGFEGVVVSLLARNNPKWIPLAAFAYSYLRIGADVMERSSDVSRELVLIIQGLIILFITSERKLKLKKLRSLFGKRVAKESEAIS